MKARTLTLVAAFAALFSVVHADPIGLVDQYLFNGNLNDSSGNGLNLAAGGTYRYVTGHNGSPNSAVQLITANPANGTFFLGTGPDLANQSSSVSFWIRDDVPGSESWVFGLGHPAGTGGSTGQDMHVSLGSGTLRYSFFNNDLDASLTLAPSAWYNLTFTYDNVTGRRDEYVNGVLFATDTTGTPFSGGDALKVGFQGSTLDDLSFYNRALTGREVEALYHVPEAGTSALYLALGLAGMLAMKRRKTVLA